jgi:universal stress protein A
MIALARFRQRRQVQGGVGRRRCRADPHPKWGAMKVVRILYASDFSKASGRAFTTAVSMAKSNAAALTILHVVPPEPRSASSATWETLETERQHWRDREMRKLAAGARRAGIRTIALVVRGNPTREILRAIRSRRANLIVIGTHGRRGLSRLVLGSVAEGIVKRAPCPVLTVRANSGRSTPSRSRTS